MMNELLQNLARVWNLFREKAIFFLPRLLAALVVLGLGWLVAVIVRTIARHILKATRFDLRCERSGFALLLRKAEIPWAPSEAVCRALYWAVLICTTIFSLSALESPVLDQVVSAFFLYLPYLAVAILILVVGFILANFLSRAALLASINKELPSAHFIAETVRTLVGLLAVTMAMEQLGIAQGTVTTTFAIAFGSIMLALALSFGLGGRSLAKDFLERKFRKDSPPSSQPLDPL